MDADAVAVAGEFIAIHQDLYMIACWFRHHSLLELLIAVDVTVQDDICHSRAFIEITSSLIYIGPLALILIICQLMGDW